MVKWDWFGQMGSNETVIFFSDHFGTKYTGWFLNNATFRQEVF